MPEQHTVPSLGILIAPVVVSVPACVCGPGEHVRVSCLTGLLGSVGLVSLQMQRQAHSTMPCKVETQRFLRA